MSHRVELAVGAVIVHDDHLLLIERATPPQAGRWSLPGGRVEPGERMADAARREVREETGIDPVIGEPVGWVERIGDDHHFVIVDFAGTVTDRSTPTAGDDASAARWVPLDQLGALEVVDGLLAFLREHGIVD